MSACENGRNHRPRASIAALSAGVGTDITGVAVGGLEQASQAFAVTKGQTQRAFAVEGYRKQVNIGTSTGEGKEWYKTRGRQRSKQILAKAVSAAGTGTKCKSQAQPLALV